jgi:hypothetical protein
VKKLAERLGPTIDELVEVACAGGETRTGRRTIHHWRRRGYLYGPVRSGREWRYPNVALGQVDTVARWRKKTDERWLRFVLYIEASDRPPSRGRRVHANLSLLLGGQSGRGERATRR